MTGKTFRLYKNNIQNRVFQRILRLIMLFPNLSLIKTNCIINMFEEIIKNKKPHKTTKYFLILDKYLFY